MSRRIELLLSGIIVVLAGAAALSGLLVPTLYRDPAVLRPQLRGQDLVTLLLGLPLLAAGMVGVARASLRGRIVWLGALGYLIYTYATYTFGAVWNPLYLVYAALLGCSLYAFVLGLLGTPADTVARQLAGTVPRRTVGIFLVTTAVVFLLLWLGDEVGALARGEVPRSVREMQIPTNFIHGIDLAVVLPALAISGALLLRRRAWGYVLAPVLLAKVTTLGAAVLTMAAFMVLDGQKADPVLAP
ncbi:MAG TPA: hypothetical protein VF832_15395, partial [Longimicrobiales bacterium]